jgi:hypothetical protein
MKPWANPDNRTIKARTMASAMVAFARLRRGSVRAFSVLTEVFYFIVAKDCEPVEWLNEMGKEG